MPTISRLVVNRVALVLLAAVIATIIWILFLQVFHISPLIGKSPSDVWSYLFSAKKADANRIEISGYLLATIRDFAVGYLVGLAVAFVAAVFFSLSVTLENVFMPTATILRSIPVIVITPLITLLFGVGIGGVTAIVTLVVFLPALANVLFGLRQAQAQHGDLVYAYGGSNFDLLWKVALPGSLPAVMASARISIPAAVTGAMIGEWLATGEGLGGFISRSAGSFGYDAMWASAVLITGFTMLAYTVVSILDALVQRRFGAL
ncbi:ABC transporter permease [Subtercola sp. RTI3]|uniref:ABC transporter permease n=1 Tax=Subtercola sp. RTI3 TaxID=3048639 RepID=UPI002B22B655|nr:ABC transporter permease subunit [Subtercola sp. RTI3]MEA9985160.1 ABC transporter permease subunit [Subtercola sp. RTI3]